MLTAHEKWELVQDCQQNWETEADTLIEAGFNRIWLDNSILPAIFIHGNTIFYLSRDTHSIEWRPVRLELGDWPTIAETVSREREQERDADIVNTLKTVGNLIDEF
jgi:hypothetical protein